MLVSAAHAKLNLSLAITGRRADGFHELISLVAPIALADTLTLDVGRPLGLTCDDASLSVDGSNLVLKAAADAEGVPFSVDCQGGMFGFFLMSELPQNYATVMKTEGAKFNTLFHGLLDRGVYIAPALYEAGFVSAAHTAEDIAATVAAAREVFKQLA